MITGEHAYATMGIARPSPQVFAYDFYKIAWQDVAGPKFSQIYNLKWAKVTTTTVSNPAYGVAAGSAVEILLFAVATSLECMQSGHSYQFAELASAVAESQAGSILK